MHYRSTEGESGTTSGIVWKGMTDMTMQTKAPESQFAYVVLAARRARQIMAGAPPLHENPRTPKGTRIARAQPENNPLQDDLNRPASLHVGQERNDPRKERA